MPSREEQTSKLFHLIQAKVELKFFFFSRRVYKNGIKPDSGWNPEVFEWLNRESIRLKLSEEDRWGGLMFDEMTIQVRIHRLFQFTFAKKLMPCSYQFIIVPCFFDLFLFSCSFYKQVNL